MKFTEATTANLEPKLRDLLKENWDDERKTFRKGLFLTGGTGVGKTYALNAVRNHFRNAGDITDVENWVELLMEVRGTFDQKNNNPLTFIKENFTSKRVVFLDDVGAEKHTEWSQEILYLIVNKLYELQKPLFLSTNLTFDEFSAKYGDRLASRLVEMCELKEITGDDKRL